MKGRKQKPTAMKRLEGNPGGRKLKTSPQNFAIAGDNPPPRMIAEDAEALELWNEIAPWLVKNGIVTLVDLPILAVHCKAYSRWVRAERHLEMYAKADKNPAGYGLMIQGERGRPVQNPCVRTSNAAMELLIKSAQEFGMTPASRGRVNKDEENDTNPFKKLLTEKLPATQH